LAGSVDSTPAARARSTSSGGRHASARVHRTLKAVSVWREPAPSCLMLCGSALVALSMARMCDPAEARTC